LCNQAKRTEDATELRTNTDSASFIKEAVFSSNAAFKSLKNNTIIDYKCLGKATLL